MDEMPQVVGRTITECVLNPDGLHITLDDGNLLVIVGVVYAAQYIPSKECLQ